MGQWLTAAPTPSPVWSQHGTGRGGVPGTHARHRVLVLNDDLPEETPLVVLVHGDAGQAQPAGQGQPAKVSLGREGRERSAPLGSSPLHWWPQGTPQ